MSYLYSLYSWYRGDVVIGWWMDVLTCCLSSPDNIRVGSWPADWYLDLRDRVQCERADEFTSIALRCRLFVVAASRILIHPSYTFFTTYVDPIFPPLRDEKTRVALNSIMELVPDSVGWFIKLSAEAFLRLVGICGPSLALLFTILYCSIFLFTFLLQASCIHIRDCKDWNRYIHNYSGFIFLVLLSWGVWFSDISSAWLVCTLILWIYYAGTAHPVYGESFGRIFIYPVLSSALLVYNDAQWDDDDGGGNDAGWLSVNLCLLVWEGRVTRETVPLSFSQELRDLVLYGDHSSAQGYYWTLFYMVGVMLEGPLQLIKTTHSESFRTGVTTLKGYIDFNSSQTLQPLDSVLQYLIGLEVPNSLLGLILFIWFVTFEGLWSLRRSFRDKPFRVQADLPYARLQFIKRVIPVSCFTLLGYFMGWWCQIPMLWFFYWSLLYISDERNNLKYLRMVGLLVFFLTFEFWYFFTYPDERVNWVIYTCSSKFYNHGIPIFENWPYLVDQDLKARVEKELVKGPLPMWLRHQIITRASIFTILLPIIHLGHLFAGPIFRLTYMICDNATWESLSTHVPFFYYMDLISAWTTSWVSFPGSIIVLAAFILFWFERGMVLFPRYGLGGKWTIFYFTFLLLCALLFHMVHTMALLLGLAYWALIVSNCVLWWGFISYLYWFRSTRYKF